MVQNIDSKKQIKSNRWDIFTSADSDVADMDIGVTTRAFLSAVLFLLGFGLSNSFYFKENPLLGIAYLAEVLISIVLAVIGFYIIPTYFVKLRYWAENLIVNTVYEIVSNFWDMQTTRINSKKRDKQKKKAQDENRKLKETLLNSLVIDTSVLIDARILDIVKAGFMDSRLVIPTSVINELHLISDNQDRLKRERGRRGLDTIKKLKDVTKVFVTATKSSEKGVDAQIIDFAKKNKLKIVTLDFNLNKVAKASGLKVLNINDLVDAVKLSVIPGDKLTVEIIQPGKEKKQGVGYMPDGTMIVVEGAMALVGETLDTTVTRVIQSSAGKIVFAEMIKKIAPQEAT